jgi:cytochrome c556
MRRFVWIAVLVLGWSGSAVLAQKVSSPEGLDKVMKSAGKASGAVNKAISAQQYADAKAQLPALRQAVKDSQNFWAEKKKADGVKFASDVLAQIDALEKEISAPAPDSSKVSATVRAMGTACGSCHRVYRGTDDENNFIVKPGLMD